MSGIYETFPFQDSSRAILRLQPNKKPLPMAMSWVVLLDHERPLAFDHSDWSQFVDWINEIDAGLKGRGLVR